MRIVNIWPTWYLINFEMNLDNWGDRETILSQSECRVSIKGFFYLDLESDEYPRGFSTSEPKLWWPRSFSTLILNNGEYPRGFSTSKSELWWPRGFSTLESELWRPKGFSTSILKKGKYPRGFFTSELELWRPRGFSTLILKKDEYPRASLPQNRSCDDQGASLPWSWWKVTKGPLYLGIGAVMTKGLLYLNLDER